MFARLESLDDGWDVHLDRGRNVLDNGIGAEPEYLVIRGDDGRSCFADTHADHLLTEQVKTLQRDLFRSHLIGVVVMSQLAVPALSPGVDLVLTGPTHHMCLSTLYLHHLLFDALYLFREVHGRGIAMAQLSTGID